MWHLRPRIWAAKTCLILVAICVLDDFSQLYCVEVRHVAVEGLSGAAAGQCQKRIATVASQLLVPPLVPMLTSLGRGPAVSKAQHAGSIIMK